MRSIDDSLKNVELLQFTYCKITNPPISQFLMIVVDGFFLQPICKFRMSSNVCDPTEIPIMKNYYFVVFAELDIKFDQIGAMNSRNDGLTSVFWEDRTETSVCNYCFIPMAES
jgi:hypothetical protein